MLSGPRRQDGFLFPQFVLFSCLDPLVRFLVILLEGRNKFFQGFHSTVFVLAYKNLYTVEPTADAKVKDRAVVSSIHNFGFALFSQ